MNLLQSADKHIVPSTLFAQHADISDKKYEFIRLVKITWRAQGWSTMVSGLNEFSTKVIILLLNASLNHFTLKCSSELNERFHKQNVNKCCATLHYEESKYLQPEKVLLSNKALSSNFKKSFEVEFY